MSRTNLLLAATVALAVCFTSSCGSEQPAVPLESLPTYSVVYGGDVTLGRRVNDALFDEKKRANIFGDVQPLLQKADLTIVNGEGVISAGGEFTDKREPRPYMFRAHPLAIEPLVKAGIDIVTAGNNHGGDYGPAALTEMLDRLSHAGIDYVGAGHNRADAREPVYKVLGDTVVAVVGADMTYTKVFEAKKDRAGTVYYEAYAKVRNMDRTVKGLTEILEEARKHAHVVLFTPHWGECWVEGPIPGIRKLAKRLIEAGYDGIIGHSSHWFHGVEIIDGKPVIYDAGNLVLDYGGGDRAHEAFLWELVVTRAGVKEIIGRPLWLKKNHSTLATGSKSEEMLLRLVNKSDEMNTAVGVADGVAVVPCQPGEIRGPEGTPKPPSRPRVKEIRAAPTDVLVEELPADAVKVNVEFPEGIRLIGYKLLIDEITVPKGGQAVILYWTTDRQVKESYKVHLEARGKDAKGKARKNTAGHIPGDWMLPTNHWPPGKIVQDWTLFRHTFHSEGEVIYYAGMWKGRMVKAVSSDQELENERLLPLGKAVYRKGAEGLMKQVEAYRASRSVRVAPAPPVVAP